MSLIDWIGKEGLLYEVDHFRKFTAKLMSVQKPLDSSYNYDQYLRDRLLSAVVIPKIRTALRDLIPRKSVQAIERVDKLQSDKPGTAGENAVEYKQEKVGGKSWRKNRWSPQQNNQKKYRVNRPPHRRKYAAANAA